jgi:hypothetical protein
MPGHAKRIESNDAIYWRIGPISRLSGSELQIQNLGVRGSNLFGRAISSPEINRLLAASATKILSGRWWQPIGNRATLICNFLQLRAGLHRASANLSHY